MPRDSALFVIRRATNPNHLDHVHDLDRICFPGEREVRLDHTKWWLAWDKASGIPVGFAGMKLVDGNKSGFLSRVGVIPSARGHNLQRRFVRVRMGEAKATGLLFVCTYVAWHNYSSLNNLAAEGFQFYDPQWAWVGRAGDFLYMRKKVGTRT